MDISSIFERGKADENKLLNYGFKPMEGGGLEYTRYLEGSGFRLAVRFKDGKVTAPLFDDGAGGEYTLHLVDGAEGGFVGEVRAQFSEILGDIYKKCFALEIFGEPTISGAIDFAKQKYGDMPEFLWKNFDGAVLRRKDTGKWYAVIMKVPYSKFGLSDGGVADVLDLRVGDADLDELLKIRGIFPAYHMNKKSWISVLCDGRVPPEEIYPLMETSYLFAK